MNYLGNTEGKYVTHVLTGLFTYANQKAGKKLGAFQDLTMYLTKGADKVFASAESSTAYIDEYIQMNPKVKFQDQRLLKSWRGCHKQTLYIFGSTPHYSYAYSTAEDKVYGVKGLSDPLDVTLRALPFPKKVNYTILPYKGEYIFDTIGMVSATKDIAKTIELYEAFRASGLSKGVSISESETDPIYFVDRTSGNHDDVYTDYMQPFFMLSGEHKDLLNVALKSCSYAWNLSMKSEEEIEQVLAEGSFKEDASFLKLCIEYRKNSFPNANFAVSKFRLLSEKGILHIQLIEADAIVEQQSLQLPE